MGSCCFRIPLIRHYQGLLQRLIYPRGNRDRARGVPPRAPVVQASDQAA
ncbi:hypothetical protein DVDV_0044 [Desulfovibrio sp. DV]|nr:hypothetical protein DVDV_0044 [Desulfovibrio sp. DV]